LWYFFGKKGGGSSSLLVLEPARVKAGESVAVESYRTIEGRRAGMHYDQASGSPGGKVEFTVGKSGMFTRNFVQEGGQLWAEIR
jgi:hypothetical protein